MPELSRPLRRLVRYTSRLHSISMASWVLATFKAHDTIIHAAEIHMYVQRHLHRNTSQSVTFLDGSSMVIAELLHDLDIELCVQDNELFP